MLLREQSVMKIEFLVLGTWTQLHFVSHGSFTIVSI